MKEWITFMKYFLISNLLIFLVASCGGVEEKPVVIITDQENHEEKIVLTKKDSLLLIAEKYGIDIDQNDSINIHEVLNTMIAKQNRLVKQLDSIDEKADGMEKLTYEFKKKEDTKLREQLINEINEIKQELERIRKIAYEKPLKKEETKVEEKEVNVETNSFENLPIGSYITRLDYKTLVRIVVKPDGEIIVGDAIIDSTTVIKGKPLNPRLQKELEQIKKTINKQ